MSILERARRKREELEQEKRDFLLRKTQERQFLMAINDELGKEGMCLVRTRETVDEGWVGWLEDDAGAQLNPTPISVLELAKELGVQPPAHRVPPEPAEEPASNAEDDFAPL